MAESAVEELTGREPVEETSFEVTEITDDEYGFTLKHPVDWTNITKTQLCEAIAPNQTFGLFVCGWDFGWEERFYVVLSVMLQDGPVELLDPG